MSGPTIGGASFDLSVSRERFDTQLDQAIADARRAAQSIRDVLSGQGIQQAAAGGVDTATADVRALSRAADAADTSLRGLATTIDRADAAAVGALRSASSLAAAYDSLAANAQTAAAALGQIGGASAQQAQVVAESARATATAIREQTTSAVQGAQQTGAAIQAETARIVDATKAQQDAQKALNTLRTAYGRENVTTGREQVTVATQAASSAEQALGAGNTAGALESIRASAAATRTALSEVNAELDALVAENPQIAQQADAFANITREIERLAAIENRTAQEQERFNLLMTRGANNDLNPEELDLSELEQEVETFNQLNSTAKNLTSGLQQLDTVQAELEGRGRTAANVAREQTRAQREAEQQARANERAERALLAAEAERQEQQARARLQYTVGTQAQQIVQSDPQVQAAIRADQVLQTVGLNAKEAEKAVNGLQQAITATGRSQAIKELQVGFEQTRVAAGALDAAMIEFGQGEPLRAFRQLEAAVQALRESLTEANVVATRLETNIAQTGSEASRQLLAQVNQQRTILNQALSGIQTSVAGVQGPQVREQARLDAEAKLREANARRQNAQAAREEYDAVLATGRAATAAQNVINAVPGLDRIGRPIGGVGRATSALQLAGFDVETGALLAAVAGVTALGAAVAETTRAGIQFNAMLQVAEVRLTATTGSLGNARTELDKLTRLTTTQTFGNFATDDLATGLEKLNRIGQDTPANLKRIADVATATGQSFTQTATQIAVFYERLDSGLPLDDTLQGLINSGVLTAKLAAQLRAADDAGASAAEKMAIFDQAVNRFAGTAERMGDTAPGSFQRLRNEMGLLAAAATSGPFEAIADEIRRISDALADPRLEKGVSILGRIAAFTTAPGIGIGIANAIRAATGIQQPEAAPAPAPDPAATQRQTIRTRYERDAPAFEAGQNAVRQYAQGFDEGSGEAFAKIEDLVEGHLKALGGGDLAANMQQALGATIEPLIARAVDDIQQYGAVTTTTAEQVRAALGDEAQVVLDLAKNYAGLRQATEELKSAKEALAAVKLQQDYEQDVAADIARIDQQAIDDAQKLQQQHDQAFDKIIAGQREIARGWQELGRIFHDSYQQAIDALDAQIKAAERQERATADAARDRIQGMQDDLSGYQEQADQRRQQAQDAIRGMQDGLSEFQAGVTARREQAQAELEAQREEVARLQAVTQAAQSAQAEHQAAYQAILAGTLDLFNQEHQQQDEITRAIIAKWDAEISGARRAKDEADQRVRAQTEQEHLLTLAYDRRAAAARAAGREDQARAIERERDRVLAAQRRAGQVDRDEAAVAADRLEDRTRDAQKDATRQQSDDQVGVNAAQARAKAAQDELDAAQKLEAQREKAEEVEIKRRQAAIERAQREESERERIEQEEIKRRQAEITHEQRIEAARAHNAQLAIDDLRTQRDDLATQQKASDAFYQGIVDHINNDTIPAIQRNQAAQKTADQQRIDDAKTIKQADDDYWADRKRKTDAAVIDAQALVDKAHDAVTEYDHQIARLIQVNSQLDDMVSKANAYVNALRAAAGLPPIPSSTSPGSTGLPQDPAQPGAGRGGPLAGTIPAGAVNTAGNAFPVLGYQGQVSQHGGGSRGGSDLFAPEGTPVVALADGVITDVSYDPLGGNTVTLHTDSGLYIYMAHLKTRAAVSAGDRVKAGQFLGYVGTTGNAAGGPPHLHIGIASNPNGFQTGPGIDSGTGDVDAVGILQGTQQNKPIPTNPAPANKPALIDGTGKSTIPDGYHAEVEPSTQTIWFVPDGFTLADYGKEGRPVAAPKPATPAPPPASAPPPPSEPAPPPPPAPEPPPGYTTPAVTCPPGSHAVYDPTTDAWSCVPDNTGGGGPDAGNKLRTADSLTAQGWGGALPLPPVAPDYPTIALPGAGARAVALGVRGQQLIDTGGTLGGGQMVISGDFLHIDRVDAGDMQQVEAMINRVEQRLIGMHVTALDTTKRGNVTLIGGRR